MSRKITFGQAVTEALNEEFARDDKFFSIGEEIRNINYQLISEEFHKQFANRIIVTPLIEEMLGSIGLGMNMGGLKPVITLSHGTFVGLAFNDLYRIGTWRYRMGESSGPGIVFRVSYGGTGRGSEFDASLVANLLHLPNLKILTPSSPHHAKGLLKTAMRYGGPVIFFEHKKLYDLEGAVPEEEYTVPFGSSSLLREGKDITLISWSFMIYQIGRWSEQLLKEGMNPEIIALHTLHPLDFKNIATSAKKTGRIVVVEEDMLRGGVGAEIGVRIAEELPNCRIKRIAAKNFPIGSGPYEHCVLPAEKDLIYVCKKIMED